ncbi:hypothetical protein FNH22_12695 [Fulvivirga sp. M361]|uniref:hypothetical protein n=1 Tax=Fulvivirga sp. M361 TaxID=2594266 RepID=UPI00117AA33C|nr:hypothetical protein [Fulvivirga sp. M361]TRX58729.1 hypothetical protein FNH22_12695 [Fulvivirga sp. M361]
MISIFLRKKRTIALFLILLMFVQIVPVPMAYGLTSGPSQPEVQSFQPAGATEMVDLFSGDFSYNIPLFELPGPNGGYPFNLSYQSGITMDQEASWVGLGFSLNPGAINRQMRGLPDEFKGDDIYTKMSIRPSVTVGLGAGGGLEIFGGAGELGLGLGISQNNYKGFGYSIDANLGYGKAAGGSRTRPLNLGISLDPKEGIGVNPSVSLDTKMGQLGVGAAYNSKAGLMNVSMTHRSPFTLSYKNKAGKEKSLSQGASSAALSLAHSGYTPQVSMPMRTVNIAAQIKAGGSWWGVFLYPYISGFYNEQWLKNDKKRIRANAYGYMNYQHAADPEDMLDINREKDGMVSREVPNLAIPSLTYDIYSVTGQGIGAMYRPMRNDYGVVHDPEAISKSTGVSFGVDAAATLAHAGVNLSINHSRSVSGRWAEDNAMNDHHFTEKSVDDLNEPWYFKVHGEPSGERFSTLENLGGDEAVRVKLTGSNSEPQASTSLENDSWTGVAPKNAQDNQERKSRSQVIQPITNEQLLNSSGNELISLFKVNYMDQNGSTRSFNRTSLPEHHIAGLTALTQEGMRYNYAIPAYNLHQEEVSFSVRKQSGQVSRVNAGNGGSGDPDYTHTGTDNFLKRVEMPPYAHSYLLTSITGPDYVDVSGDGLSPDDLGYWVKFTYQKTTTNTDRYKWRDPYSKAHFQEGWETDPRDDKGSFVYGEKELWYLTQAETKSHIATFSLQTRQDGRGVAAKLQDVNNQGKTVQALSEIKLFTRSAGSQYPIKSVKFDYDYSLCPGVFNNGSGGGKLTLKKLWFEYGSSTRGSLNPYEFTYHNNNPAYDLLAYDRWGSYKPYPAQDYEYNRDFPYSEQDPAKKDTIDSQAAVWSLKQIQLPSGGKIMIDYETDDYAYVQHLQAMQMTAIADPYTAVNQAQTSNRFNLKDEDLKIRFKLEKPLPGDFNGDQRKEVLKYLDEKRKQVFFKTKINLRSTGENFHEHISGYADIDFNASMGLEKETAGDYIYGYFYLKGEEGRHPFSLRAWQHIRTNQPDLANSGRKLQQTNSATKRVKQMKSLGSVAAQLRQMFGGFYSFCHQKGWGRDVIVDKSWIRMKSPDKIKYGGGLRVRQITMTDAWPEDEEGIYGQVYEYTIEEEGAEISSGVAAYEPFIGGEENALRHAKRYTNSVPLRSDNNLFFEYPINETYYPGPQVGYRQVKVMSLPAAYHVGKEVKNITLSDGNPLFPSGDGVSYGTSGMTVHEFYTAKDFPVLTDETEKDDKPYKLSVIIPFLGSITVSKLSTSQGYSVITNDMHGKLKQVSNYRQDRLGNVDADPMSWVRYNYRSDERFQDRENVFEVTNIFKDNGDGTLSIPGESDSNESAVPKYTLGQESEFFMDMRQFEDRSWGGSGTTNVDIVMIPLIFVVVPVPIPTVWPNISKDTRQMRTAVTNKVIFRSGILESVEAYDGGSLITTQNLKWDKLTGTPVLTSVNNNFDDPVYTYTIPAYTEYQGMGAAYKNVGLTFSLTDVRTAGRPEDNSYRFSTPVMDDVLFPGDEVIMYPVSEGSDPVGLAIYTGKEEGAHRLFSVTPLPDAAYQALVVRSGRRNLLAATAGTISALDDPSVPGSNVSYSKIITLPNE